MCNRLLGALPPDDLARILPTLDTLSLPIKYTLHSPAQPVEYVYFPGDGFCSVLAVLEDGRMVEVVTVGREGLVGLSAAIDGGLSPSAAMVQAHIETCYRMTANDFRREMERRGAFFDLCTRYAHATVGVVMQSTACNAVHSVEQRLSRWLLMAYDRVGRTEFPLTQEFVAMMLGTSRPAVSVVAGTLQRAGLITYHRGHVTILDKTQLESASCECYRAATALLDAVTVRRPGTSRRR